MWATRVVLEQIDRLSLVFLCKGPTKHPQTPAGLSFLAKDHGRSGSRRCDHHYGTGWPHGCTVASRFR
jgi:hypothetical protein